MDAIMSYLRTQGVPFSFLINPSRLVISKMTDEQSAAVQNVCNGNNLTMTETSTVTEN